MIQFRNSTLGRGARCLIEDATLQIHEGWRVDLVGANGSGKSSLFALLRGQLLAERGDCEVPAGWTVASVAQETPALSTDALEQVSPAHKRLGEVQAHAPAAPSYGSSGRLGLIPAHSSSSRTIGTSWTRA